MSSILSQYEAIPDDADANSGGRLTWDNPRRVALMNRMRPEIQAGGYAHDDLLMNFYFRVYTILRPDMTVLDFGAGRGASLNPAFKSFHADFQRVQGRVAHIVGADVDEAVLEHPFLDERIVIKPNAPLPFADETFDAVLSLWVVEHLDKPGWFVAELHRILKPGGWFCGLTPNRRGYVGIATQLIPWKAHNLFLRALIPERADRDAFPTCYRLNTLGAVRRYFSDEHWINASYSCSGVPRYHANSALLFRLMAAIQRLSPPLMDTDLMLFLQKKGARDSTRSGR